MNEELTHREDIPYEEDESIPPMDWVREQLGNEEHFTWYDQSIWTLWVELGTLISVSKQTTIPANTVSRHIRNINKKLKELWLEQTN